MITAIKCETKKNQIKLIDKYEENEHWLRKGKFHVRSNFRLGLNFNAPRGKGAIPPTIRLMYRLLRHKQDKCQASIHDTRLLLSFTAAAKVS